jgi:hypothetical protein
VGDLLTRVFFSTHPGGMSLQVGVQRAKSSSHWIYPLVI